MDHSDHWGGSLLNKRDLQPTINGWRRLGFPEGIQRRFVRVVDVYLPDLPVVHAHQLADRLIQLAAGVSSRVMHVVTAAVAIWHLPTATRAGRP